MQLELDRRRQVVPNFETIMSSGRYKQVLTDCFFILVHPYPFLVGKDVQMYNTIIESDMSYHLNDFLQLFAMIRVVKACIKLINLSAWRSNSA